LHSPLIRAAYPKNIGDIVLVINASL